MGVVIIWDGTQDPKATSFGESVHEANILARPDGRRALRRGGTTQFENLVLARRPLNLGNKHCAAGECGYPEIRARTNRPLQNAALIAAFRRWFHDQLNAAELVVESPVENRARMETPLTPIFRTRVTTMLCASTKAHRNMLRLSFHVCKVGQAQARTPVNPVGRSDTGSRFGIWYGSKDDIGVSKSGAHRRFDCTREADGHLNRPCQKRADGLTRRQAKHCRSQQRGDDWQGTKWPVNP
ncbi:MAG: hypothetical protein M1294_13630 [Firmicutes bacterium]|jgi:hypothetical protein|nr:hypothetical protein [Bacillota bacterium]MCL5015565.1 hypothetical protein [Bacillota bacterium]